MLKLSMKMFSKIEHQTLNIRLKEDSEETNLSLNLQTKSLMANRRLCWVQHGLTTASKQGLPPALLLKSRFTLENNN
jgi:hypothetical protein